MGPRPTRNCAVLDLGQVGVRMCPALYQGSIVKGDYNATRSSLQSKVIHVQKVSTGQCTAAGGVSISTTAGGGMANGEILELHF
jgi:3-oxoacyl-ACP reductase-like protein